MADMPLWAEDLVREVWRKHGTGKPEPKVSWRKSISHSSSGRYYPIAHRLVVTAGMYETDQRCTLIHEIAHALTPGHHHDKVFWQTFWRLALAENINIPHALNRSAQYRIESIRVAVQMRIDGAQSVYDAHRLNQIANRRMRQWATLTR